VVQAQCSFELITIGHAIFIEIRFLTLSYNINHGRHITFDFFVTFALETACDLRDIESPVKIVNTIFSGDINTILIHTNAVDAKFLVEPDRFTVNIEFDEVITRNVLYVSNFISLTSGHVTYTMPSSITIFSHPVRLKIVLVAEIVMLYLAMETLYIPCSLSNT
jgi:hypothetical protein